MFVKLRCLDSHSAGALQDGEPEPQKQVNAEHGSGSAGMSELGFHALSRRLQNVDQFAVAPALQVGDGARARFLGDPIDDRLLNLRRQPRRPRSSIQLCIDRGQMRHEMRHAAFAAGQMKDQMRPHQRPAQAGAIGDRRVGIGDRHHAFRHQVNDLAPQRGLQAVGDMARHFLLDVDRLLADRPDRIPSRLAIACGEVFGPPTTSTSGMRCGGLNGWPITQRSGCLHLAITRLINRPDELEAITISGGAPRRARRTGRSSRPRVPARFPARIPRP